METFDPVKYSLEENQFFLKHLGESPVSALKDTLPKGVNPVTVQEVLGKVYELDELQKHRGTAWVGHSAIKGSIERYLHESEKWKQLAKRGAPRFPTMSSWDGKGRPHRGAVSSDASQVTTYLDDNGNRKPLAVRLQDDGPGYSTPWAKKEAPLPEALVEDAEKGMLQCPVDGWATNYNPDSRASENLARARMSKHCKTSKDDRVREFGLRVFS